MLIDFAYSRNKATWRIILALGASFLLHFVILSKPGLFALKGAETGRSTLQISLVAPVSKPAFPADTRPVSVPEKVSTVQEKKPSEKKEKLNTASVPSLKQAEPLITEKTSSSAVIKPPQIEQSPGVPLPGLTGMVRQVAIKFEFYAGPDRHLTGIGTHRYSAENGENYGVSVKQIVKEGEISGEGQWQLEVSGTIGRQGLSPQIYEMHGAFPEKLMTLKGVSDSAPITRGKVSKGRMRDGILDRQSLLYQFMLQPPELTGGKMWLSDGSINSQFFYRLGGTESLIIPSLGGVRALILIFSSRESNETIELWLIPDMHFLPAKVRYTDKQGEVSEQVAISLEFK